MPNPKRRHSVSRRDKRRANWKLHFPTLSLCPMCKEFKLPHFACFNCGYYNEEKIIKTKKEIEEERKRKGKS